MTTTTCFELETRNHGYVGRIPDSPLQFSFTEHFCEQLKKRWDRDVAEVLVSLPRGRVFASNGRGCYAAELTGSLLRSHHMIVIVAAPDRYNPDSVALVTVYPVWNGDISASHVSIIRRWEMQLVRRLPLVEILEREMAR